MRKDPDVQRRECLAQHHPARVSSKLAGFNSHALHALLFPLNTGGLWIFELVLKKYPDEKITAMEDNQETGTGKQTFSHPAQERTSAILLGHSVPQALGPLQKSHQSFWPFASPRLLSCGSGFFRASRPALWLALSLLNARVTWICSSSANWLDGTQRPQLAPWVALLPAYGSVMGWSLRTWSSDMAVSLASYLLSPAPDH